ncbi:hypothetical protein O181_110917 [Austropuccinia psidii MF-1]|uniref:Retrotransposon gag domain-containing protein n=1 Tax=Austropuccinia psidii MF-1 TaxID=1389203 RepID=A0A9Q3K0S5_9BASI|nr:hypothetical protein [Austropuccinia psidii MF-1]
MSEGARARLGEVEDEEGEESVEEEHSGETEVADALEKAPEIMEQMATIMGQLSQAEAPRYNFKAPALKTPSMKPPDSFYGTQAHKLRVFIQSYQLIFHNDPANFFSDRKKALYSTSFLTFRKAEQELDNLRMKESGHVSLYIADFRSLMSRIGDWGERAYIHVYRRGLASRLLDQLASHPGTFDTLQELMDVTLELDTRYHERQKEKGGNQEKKPPVNGSNQSRPPQNSSSKRPHQKKNKKGKQFQSSKDKPHAALLNKDNKLIGSEKERRIKEGLCTYCGGKHPIEKCFKRPQNKPGSSSRGFPSKQGKA